MATNSNKEQLQFYQFTDDTESVRAVRQKKPHLCNVFGQPSSVGDVNNPYFFTGRRYDTETGLYYYRARYYNAEIGRFLQTDPIGYSGGLNLYAYCGNNPLNWIDPFGLWTEAAHRWLGRHGRSKFDYGRLDRDYHPHSRHWWRHFRNRYLVGRDLEDACRRGDARAFEYHMHELQDTYSHGEAFGGVLSHTWHGHNPDNPELHREAWGQADRMTRLWERMWDRYNPPELPDPTRPPTLPLPDPDDDDDNDVKKGS